MAKAWDYRAHRITAVVANAYAARALAASMWFYFASAAGSRGWQ